MPENEAYCGAGAEGQRIHMQAADTHAEQKIFSHIGMCHTSMHLHKMNIHRVAIQYSLLFMHYCEGSSRWYSKAAW
jgi:hypothetical protein